MMDAPTPNAEIDPRFCAREAVPRIVLTRAGRQHTLHNQRLPVIDAGTWLSDTKKTLPPT